jgi:ankyrin repeat protein
MYLKLEADVNISSEEEKEPYVCIAIYRRIIPLICLLVRHGADIHLRDLQGDKPLHWALRHGCRNAIISFLRENGAEPERIDQHGKKTGIMLTPPPATTVQCSAAVASDRRHNRSIDIHCISLE